MTATSNMDPSNSDRKPVRFGEVMAADLEVPLDKVPAEVRGVIRCRNGHLMASLTKDPDVLYTGGQPVNLSDSVRVVVSAWDRAEGCVDQGLWEIEMSKLRPRIKWRKGKLHFQIADVARRYEHD